MKESLLKPNKKFTLLSAFITLLNDRLSESILLPILPSFVLLFDSKASTYGLLSCTYQLAQFTASPFIGLMSDRYGRRPVTLFCITGSVIGISILSFTVLFNWSNSIASIPLFLLFLARLIDGLSGGTAATATTILADISSPEKRAKTFGLIGVAFGLSFFLGNIFVVIFARNTNNNFIIPVLIASIIPIINFLLVFFYLPETKPNSEINKSKTALKNPLKALFTVFKEEKIKKLSLAFFIYFIAFTGLTNILIFFLQESLKNKRVSVLFFYLDDSSDSKAMAPIISGLDLIWRNNIDIIALTTDELQDKEKSDLRNEPNYYWNGLIPQTIILNSDGEIKYDKNGMINIDELNKVIGELKGIDIEDTTFSVESFNEYNSIISEKKDKNIN